MPALLHHLIRDSAASRPGGIALRHKQDCLSYAQLWQQVQCTAAGLRSLGLEDGARIAIQLPKDFDSVAFMFAASAAGYVFVPINPVLKPRQVAHILRDSGASLLLTNSQRATALLPELTGLSILRGLILNDESGARIDHEVPTYKASEISALAGKDCDRAGEAAASSLAAILYTSGSTGLPKGVMLSHANLVIGARSVNAYLQVTPEDRILALLPFSFDYGLSQLTTSFAAGAEVVLMEYLLPQIIPRAIEQYRITGVAGVPVMWNQLSRVEWPAGAASLRYLTNSGGAMPVNTTRRLHQLLPDCAIYLMYGLTEAFRSTYLDPSLADSHPDSIGRAIPNAEIHVVRPDGSECEANEEGELIHLGPLVTLGYWNTPEADRQVFRSWNGCRAVWSGDTVVRDDDGLLYFRSRADEMIKTSGYRVSPTEIESVALMQDNVTNAVVVGMDDAELGQAIILFVEGPCEPEQLEASLQRELPSYMVPSRVECLDEFPLTPNGKPDRAALKGMLESIR